MTQLQFSFVHLQETSSSQEDSDQDLPPLTPVLATTSTMSFELDSALTTPEQPNKMTSSMINKDSEKSSTKPPQESDPFAQQQESMAMTYMVSLLHALPYIFRVSLPPLCLREGVIQPLDHQELVEILRELDAMDIQGMTRISSLLNLLFLQRHHISTYATLHTLPISMPTISMALTLILAIYPYQYGWNYLGQSPTSPITQTPQTLVSRLILQNETYYYSQFNDGIVIHQDNQFKTYHDKSYIPTHMKDFHDNPTDYPYGWTQGIEEFCHNNNHHPDCKQPIRRTSIEREFVASIINNPDMLYLLDDYLQTIYNNRFGRNLQWLHSSPAPVLKTTIKNALNSLNFILKLTRIKDASTTLNKDFELPSLKKDGSIGRCSLLIPRSHSRESPGHN